MPSTATVLTGLSLATDIVREATDGVPIVKQVLAVASRIVGLAEQVDKNREDLQALVDRAKKMDRTITAVVADREVGDNMLRSLEDMNSALRAVETYFENHIRRGRVRKTLGYIFTARKDVDRLRGEYDERLKELEVAANLDTNLFSREKSRFIGEFRNIRHCEITLLRPIGRVHNDGTEPLHLANCEGSNKVFVVRNMNISGLDEHQRRCMEERRQLLERLSLIQNRHPVIACLYGRNSGPKGNRFVVLEAGNIRPFEIGLGGRAVDISVLGRMVAQLADGSRHLEMRGAKWWSCPGETPTVYVDHNYNPTIGIDTNFLTIETEDYVHAECASVGLGFILDESTIAVHHQRRLVQHTHHRSVTWSKQLFGDLFDSGYRIRGQENMVRRADIANAIPLSQESRTYLNQVNPNFGSFTPLWGFVLLGLAVGNRKREGSFVDASYFRLSADLDRLVDGQDDVVYHTSTCIEIPRSDAPGVTQRLDIPIGGEEDDEEVFVLSCAEGEGDDSMECTGWAKCNRHLAEW